jgi:hypothetical protein
MTNLVIRRVYFLISVGNFFSIEISRKEARLAIIEEKSLERMEALLSYSTLGVHVLFENSSIADALREVKDDKDFYDFKKMKKVQDVMTELIAKKSYVEKVDYLKSLDNEAYQMLVRAYFHIVENTIRATHEFPH